MPAVAPPAAEAEPAPSEVLESVRDAFTAARTTEFDPAANPTDAASCRSWSGQLESLWQAYGMMMVEAKLLDGYVRRLCGQPERAREAFTAAMTNAPRWARAQGHVGLAALDMDGGETKLAQYSLERALLLDASMLAARLELARLLVARYGEDANEADFEQARQLLQPRADGPLADREKLVLARLWLYRAVALDERAGEAQLLLSELLVADDPKTRAQALTLLGLDHRRSGGDPDALRAFEAAIEADIDATEAWAHIGLIRAHQRDGTGALVALARAQTDVRFTDRPDILHARAKSLVLLGRFDGARLTYERLAEIDPTDPLTTFGLATLAETQAGESDDLQTKELYLADASRHYRAFLREAPLQMATLRGKAQAYLHDYAEVETQGTRTRRRGRRDQLSW